MQQLLVAAPDVVALPPPAISQAMGLSHGREQLGIEELISEPAVERFGKAVLLQHMVFCIRSDKQS